MSRDRQSLELSRALAACLGALCAGLGAASAAHADDSDEHRIEHVLLLSVDGMHEVDLQRYVAAHPASALARIVGTGVHFSNAHTSRPSDSFPGLMAFMTGGSPLSHGVFYDDSYDRTLYAPGSQCIGTPGTEVQFAENIDFDLSQLDGGGPIGSNHIDPSKLPLRLANGRCLPVYPHQYLKVNTIMEVIHAAGKRTAWSDKHPAYEIVAGPSGTGLDELYTPEINATTVPGHPGDDWTTDPSYTRVYDGYKVAGVLNQIRGMDHTGMRVVGVPAIFGMNFQAVSVAQKVTADGYLDAQGTPSVQLAASLDAVDAALTQMLGALDAQHLTRSTLLIVGAKHGQSPIDVGQLHMMPPAQGGTPNPKAAALDVMDPADLLSGGGVALAQETADDVSLIWLANQGQLAAALALLEADRTHANHTRIQKIYAGAELQAQFGHPAAGRTPDIIIQPIPGTIYSSSKKKIAEHGGFADDDTHVALVLSNPSLRPSKVDTPVTNAQVAPTILRALGLEPQRLEAVRREGTRVLPGLDLAD